MKSGGLSPSFSFQINLLSERVPERIALTDEDELNLTNTFCASFSNFPQFSPLSL